MRALAHIYTNEKYSSTDNNHQARTLIVRCKRRHNIYIFDIICTLCPSMYFSAFFLFVFTSSIFYFCTLGLGCIPSSLFFSLLLYGWGIVLESVWYKFIFLHYFFLRRCELELAVLVTLVLVSSYLLILLTDHICCARAYCEKPQEYFFFFYFSSLSLSVDSSSVFILTALSRWELLGGRLSSDKKTKLLKMKVKFRSANGGLNSKTRINSKLVSVAGTSCTFTKNDGSMKSNLPQWFRD